MNLKFITHLETFATNAQLHKLVSGNLWSGACSFPDLIEGDRRTLLLRVQNDAKLENWDADLPMHDRPDFEKWKSLRALLSRARKAIACDPIVAPNLDLTAPLGRVVIAVLQPGGVVPWQIDPGEYADRHLQFCVALVTNPRVLFYCNGDGAPILPGSLVYFDATEYHSVVNFGDAPCAHVVFGLRRREAPDASV